MNINQQLGDQTIIKSEHKTEGTSTPSQLTAAVYLRCH